MNTARTGLKMASGESSSSPMASDDEKHDYQSKRTGSVEETSSEANGDAREAYIIDKALEKKLLRKFDFIILPTVALMYLFK